MAFLNIYLENGCQFTDRTLRVATPAYFTDKRWFQYFNILREYFLSIFEDTEQQLRKFIQIKPHTIRGYTSAIKSLALKIKETMLQKLV